MLCCAQPCQSQFQTRIAGASPTNVRAAQGPPVSYHFFTEIELSLQSGAPSTSAFRILNCKWSSRYSPVRFVLTTFPDQIANPRKQRPYSGEPRSHNDYLKKPRVSRPRVFSPVNSRASGLLHFPNYLIMGGWHDDVVDMMMGLTWWCGWHDDRVNVMMRGIHDGLDANHDHCS